MAHFIQCDIGLFYHKNWLSAYNYTMENKILNRISELSNEINELLQRREELAKELHETNVNINILYNSIHELKNLLTSKEGEI